MTFENLNEQQKAAVQFDHHLLLTACPGSGKTRVITHKIAHELGRLTHPNRRIIALTFTIRAAEEIERRLQKMELDTSKLWSGNIHAFCLNWILRPYAGFHPKTKHGFVIIDAVKSGEILNGLIQNQFPNLQEDFKFSKPNVKIQPDEGLFLVKKPTHAVLFETYRSELEVNRFVDFEHLLFYSLELLRSFPKIAITLSRIFQNILIDEFQDTQELQYRTIFEIIRAGQGHTKVCFVGDCDQAIYGSLGGVAKSKAEIEAGIGAEIHEFNLVGNYRSSQRVIDFYRNFQSVPLDITAKGSSKDNRGRITLNRAVHKDHLAEEIARLIQLSLDDGIPPEEIGILVPQWFLIMPLARKMKQLLPAISFDASGIAPMSNSRDNLFYKISRLFLTETSRRLYSVRQRWANEIGEELAISVGIDPDDRQFSARKILKIVNSVQSSETDAIAHLHECLTRFIAAFRIEMSDFPALSVNFESFFKGVQNRIERAKKEGDPLPDDIETFRNFYREAHGVVISSVHGAKGEEFETVIAFAILQDILPYWAEPKNEKVEVSKKLLYVLCSRAKNNLHLIMEQGRKRRNREESYQPNQQLDEMRFEYDNV